MKKTTELPVGMRRSSDRNCGSCQEFSTSYEVNSSGTRDGTCMWPILNFPYPKHNKSVVSMVLDVTSADGKSCNLWKPRTPRNFNPV